MKKLLIIWMLIVSSSCSLLKDRTVDKNNERYKFIDRSVITERTPGDVIVMPAPRTPKDRPRDTTITTRGEKGATVTTSYDREGRLDGQTIICPETEKTKQMNVEGEYKLKTKQVESKANIELADTVGKWSAITFIPIGFFFALAFYLRK